jgi:hypothetical protein
LLCKQKEVIEELDPQIDNTNSLIDIELFCQLFLVVVKGMRSITYSDKDIRSLESSPPSSKSP